MSRSVEPEQLDRLAPSDAAALRSRRDLQRLNSFMGNDAILANVLRWCCPTPAPGSLTELGAGDGMLMLNVLRRMQRFWKAPDASARLLLVDRYDVVTPETRQDFIRLGWTPEVIGTDVFDWFQRGPRQPTDLMVANLFLHHFSAEKLARLFEAIVCRTEVFVALEPRRSWLAGLCSRCVGLIGCGPVTRHDARVSVRAGFAGRELSALWPEVNGWTVHERPAGLFGHLFVAGVNLPV